MLKNLLRAKAQSIMIDVHLGLCWKYIKARIWALVRMDRLIIVIIFNLCDYSKLCVYKMYTEVENCPSEIHSSYTRYLSTAKQIYENKFSFSKGYKGKIHGIGYCRIHFLCCWNVEIGIGFYGRKKKYKPKMAMAHGLIPAFAKAAAGEF